jgi:hypothetical protein
MKKITSYILLLIGVLIVDGCIESVEYANVTVDSNLVVNAILTNEFKNHTVELSKTIPIDSTKLSPEKNASVFITDNTGTIYNFQETEDGIYTSLNSFSAEVNKKYTLTIETNNGQKYTSTEEMLPGTSTVGDINISVEENEINQVEELVIKANSNLSTDEGKYYRYEYDETYKIKTPIWSQKKLLIISDTNPYEFELVDKTPEEDGIGFCYGNKKSKKILVTETLSLSQDQVVGFPIRQIPLDSYIIGLRYSILVKQYVINRNTFDFYTLLDKFSDPDDIFSQTQVGNIPSNIKSVNKPEEDKVIGFFEVSSLSTKRIFFNRDEITNTIYKNYRPISFCADRVTPEIEDSFGRSPLLERLTTRWIYQGIPDFPTPNTPYLLALKVCGDCSHLGPVNPPSFWTE